MQKMIPGREISLRTGDIHPSETATILNSTGRELTAEDMVWGFPGYRGSGLLINARAETITEKYAFKDSVRSRRCVIPAKGFYEWNRNKEMYHFEDPGSALFMAGCFDPQNRFVIITTAANESVMPVHDRMPLLLAEDEIEIWLKEEESMDAILQKVPEPLHRWTQYSQMTLFDES